MPALDEDAVKACAGLVSRTGATAFQIGYLSDDPPHGWYAYAQYRGARISADDQPGPVEAADALARKLLTGAVCQHCQGLVTLTSAGAVAYPGMMTDGTTRTAAELAAKPQCRWTRMGARWVAGCQQ
jgi:hypothetical protein